MGGFVQFRTDLFKYLILTFLDTGLGYPKRYGNLNSGRYFAWPKKLDSGKTVYTARIPKAKKGYYATPVAANGCVYLACDNGMLSVIKAGEKFEVVSQCDLGDRICATPAFAGDRL